MDVRIAAVPANIKCKAACLVGIDRAVFDHYVAVVVRQRIGGRVIGVVQRQRHAVQRQVAVVLNQHLRLLGVDRAVLEGDLVVLQQLERLRLRTRAADHRAVHRVDVAVEVHRHAGRELALRRLDTVAAAVRQHRDGVTVHSRRKRGFQTLVLRLADLSNTFSNHVGIVILGVVIGIRHYIIAFCQVFGVDNVCSFKDTTSYIARRIVRVQFTCGIKSTAANRNSSRSTRGV